MSPHPFPFGFLDEWSDRDDDSLCQLLLNVEDPSDLAVILLSPQVSARHPVDQLRGQPELAAHPTDASLKDVADPQFLGDSPHVDWPTFEREGAVAGNDEQRAEAGQFGDDVLA